MIYSNDKHFFNKINNQEREELLNHLGNTSCDIFLWLKNEPENLEQFKSVGILSDKRICLEISGSLLKKITSSTLVNKTILIKFNIKNYFYFSTGHLSSGADNRYYLLVGSPIFRHEQRKDFRIEASRLHRIQFKVDDEVFEGLDVSAGGISFKAKIKNNDRFKPGNNYPGCKLRINQFQCNIRSAKVVKTFEKIYKDKTDGKNYKFLTVCLQFHGLTEEEENALASFILNEARGIMLAKKFLSK
ncbi:MAG: hypothetical protein A2381_17645 [Bdellovibrionales bacterium RIFOXYB1_FULL_37_110]|nr:MAG: hypothetical protein A2181_00770 [Bdellovibrionales bacterium RIFOXYA1_FULL_38_20]OFZ48014.1 MAG: hypothetical protein A2417_15620 [Bdellovibrionales bacterium RIFOXYC1_FULL_37_79]OFZ58031.1 MAG: hypothetical protein A2381_17645 [Bdellovibrionales bacterium RIFOXYB1_FULL_37_110]OFZ61675.1 MAG: hypothetical protein A2577_18140 [Bdellovibrionales bacterium RIFOXYD1_FULL_36_51]